MWVALAAGPVVFLLDLEAAYALTSWACGDGSPAVLHALHVVSALLIAGAGAFAWREWRRGGGGWPGEGGDVPEHRRFLSVLAILSSAGFALLILALWIPLLFLHPCDMV